MSTQISRNVFIHGRRTSLRLERTIWEALEEACLRERTTLNALCTQIKDLGGERTLTASLRVYVLDYYRAAATQEGHEIAGHGALPPDAHSSLGGRGTALRPAKLRGLGGSRSG